MHVLASTLDQAQTREYNNYLLSVKLISDVMGTFTSKDYFLNIAQICAVSAYCKRRRIRFNMQVHLLITRVANKLATNLLF